MDLQGGSSSGSLLTSGAKLAGGVYWKGTDGNIYYKTSSGVSNLGSGGASQAILNGASEIADPNPGGTQTTTTAAPRTTSTAPVLDTAALASTDQAIGSLDTEFNNGAANIDDSLRNVTGRYDAERGRNEGDYNENSVTNNQNLQKNKHNALIAAAQGRRGLRGTLSAIGALNGSGVDLSDRVVTDAANGDIGEASDTFRGNQTTLDKAWRNFDEEDRQRRADAETSAKNSRTALEGSIAGKRQQMLNTKADILAKGGRQADADAIRGQAGGLNNEIATKSRVTAAPIVERSAAFTPGELADYLAGQGDMTVDVAAGGAGGQAGGIPGASTLLAGKKDRKKDAAVAVAA
jgi:hypothetical protein